MNDLDIWLERLSSLYKSQMRQAVSAEGIQLVHLEILRYLSISNKYSNTAQAMSEYLGQTKGSISQSLKLLEKEGYIERRTSTEDKRVVRVYLAQAGHDCLQRMSEHLMLNLDESPKTVAAIQSLLHTWQDKNNHKGFGQCQSCRFNQQLGRGKFQCGLTGEALSKADVKKICREHEFDDK